MTLQHVEEWSAVAVFSQIGKRPAVVAAVAAAAIQSTPQRPWRKTATSSRGSRQRDETANPSRDRCWTSSVSCTPGNTEGRPESATGDQGSTPDNGTAQACISPPETGLLQDMRQAHKIDGWTTNWSSETEDCLEINLAIGGTGCRRAERASRQGVSFAEDRRRQVAHQRGHVDVVGDVATDGGQRECIAA